MPSWTVRDGVMIPMRVIWCNHPDHPLPGWTETSSRWCGVVAECDEDRAFDAIVKHCEKHDEDHRRYIVFGENAYKVDFH
jgi:hypothetical protein